MRFLLCAAAFAATVSSLAIGERASDELFVLELEPGVTKVVTESEKWALKAEGIRFFDVTEEANSVSVAAAVPEQKIAATFPPAVQFKDKVTSLISQLDKANFRTILQPFTEFQNRYYRSDYGRQSSVWLQSKIKEIVTASGATNVVVQAFSHSFVQSSIIVTVPGKSAKTIVLGAHQDSINGASPSAGRAPGADDDGTGVVTILETLRVLLKDSTVKAGQAPNTLEFHFYAGEEGGLLGSQAIFKKYSEDKKDVKAMLQQDMTGYTEGTIKAGKKESIGVLTDYVDADLTAFLKRIITAYCDIPYVESKCGYACSDHASATKYGYPSSFAFESAFSDSSPYIHTAQDTISTVNFDHVLQHARLSLGFAYELAFSTSL